MKPSLVAALLCACVGKRMPGGCLCARVCVRPPWLGLHEAARQSVDTREGAQEGPPPRPETPGSAPEAVREPPRSAAESRGRRGRPPPHAPARSPLRDRPCCPWPPSHPPPRSAHGRPCQHHSRRSLHGDVPAQAAGPYWASWAAWCVGSLLRRDCAARRRRTRPSCQRVGRPALLPTFNNRALCVNAAGPRGPTGPRGYTGERHKAHRSHARTERLQDWRRA